MVKKFGGWMFFLGFLSFLMISPHGGFSAPLPKSTQEMLKKLKLDRSILTNLDEELRVPKDWTEKARREGNLKIISTWNPRDAKVMLAPFRERYPFIAIDHRRAGTMEVRDVKVLTAFKSGKVLADILTSIGGTFYKFREYGAIEDLSNIPAMARLPKEAKDPNGLWAGTHVVYWCLAYNTRRVKKEDLPKKWEDLLTNPRWRNGNLAVGNRPYLVGLPRWMAKGEDWAKDFITRLFNEVKPQLRKEGVFALTELLAAGEFDAVIPAMESRVYQVSLKGAPVSFMCPEPVPFKVGDIVIMKGAPNLHAARIFINWLLSKEGQIAQYVSAYRAPVHADLRRPEFLPFADEILGKETSYWDSELEHKVMPKLVEFWNSLWLGGGRGR